MDVRSNDEVAALIEKMDASIKVEPDILWRNQYRQWALLLRWYLDDGNGDGELDLEAGYVDAGFTLRNWIKGADNELQAYLRGDLSVPEVDEEVTE